MYLFYNHPLQSYGFRWYKSVVNSATHLLTQTMVDTPKSMNTNSLNKPPGKFNEDEY